MFYLSPLLKNIRLAILFIIAAPLASQAQITWQFKPFQSVGYSSNILLSPAVLALTNGDTIGKNVIYSNDFYHKVGLANRVAKTRNNGEVLGINTNIQTQNYLEVKLADTYMIKNVVDYKFKVDTDFTFIPRLGLERTKKVTIDILTDDGVNTYDYWYYFGGSEGFYRVNKKLRIGADVECGWKTYKTMASGRNFTHMQYLASIEAEYWVNKLNFFNFGYAFKRYDFKNLQSEFLPNTLIDWQYQSVFATAKYKIDNDHYMAFTTELESKSDFNKGDFSFSQWNNKLVWDWYFNKFGVYGDLQANFRNYKRRTAYTEVNTDDDYLFLKYNYYTVNLKLKYNWNVNSMIYAGYSRELRETNSTQLEKKYRRPFEFYGFSFGWTYTFNKQFERAKPITNL
jgi:hypothetical protein